MPWMLTSALIRNVSGTQPLHSPALRWSFWPWISMSAAPEPSVQRTVIGRLMSLPVASASSRACSFSERAPCFFFSRSFASSCFRIGLSGPRSVVSETPPSSSSRFRKPPNSVLPSSYELRSVAQ